MKRITLLLLLTFALMNHKKCNALGPADTLLVYFSDDIKVNQQYYDILKIKFPNINLRLILDQEEFNRFVPQSNYSKRTRLFGDYYIMENFLPKYVELGGYYFFDISLRRDTKSYQVSKSDGSWGTTTQVSVIKTYSVELVNYSKGKFTNTRLNAIHLNRGFQNRDIIKLGSMDSCSDWVNPLYIAMFLKTKLEPELTQGRRPCDFSVDDTVYACESLNRENVSKEIISSPVEKNFKTHLRYFRHKHIKLRNFEFSERASRALKNNNHFLFFYYNQENDYYSIIDALDFKVVYFVKAPARIYFQSKRYVKRATKFSKKCK